MLDDFLRGVQLWRYLGRPPCEQGVQKVEFPLEGQPGSLKCGREGRGAAVFEDKVGKKRRNRLKKCQGSSYEEEIIHYDSIDIY